MGPQLEGYWRVTRSKPSQVLSAGLGSITEKSFHLTALVITLDGVLQKKAHLSVSPACSHFAGVAPGCACRFPLILSKVEPDSAGLGGTQG